MYINSKPINPTEIIAGGVAIYENIWENVDETINTIEGVVQDKDSGVYFERAQTLGDQMTGNPLVQTVRTNLLLDLTKSGHMNESIRLINNDFNQKMWSAIDNYIKIFDIQHNIFDVEGYTLLKYSGGQHYDAHYDGGGDSKRNLSAILYLNSDYEGGELEFVNFNIKIKPSAGMLLLFPANYPYRHIAHPVTSGTKYAIVSFLHDRK
jgi:predicted 2-oxoglutarate/Fe(II)-dependent dioxygenase YbiX